MRNLVKKNKIHRKCTNPLSLLQYLMVNIQILSCFWIKIISVEWYSEYASELNWMKKLMYLDLCLSLGQKYWNLKNSFTSDA